MGKNLGDMTIRKKSQVTLPKSAIDYLNLKEGDKLTLVDENGHILLKRVKVVTENFNVNKS